MGEVHSPARVGTQMGRPPRKPKPACIQGQLPGSGGAVTNKLPSTASLEKSNLLLSLQAAAPHVMRVIPLSNSKTRVALLKGVGGVVLGAVRERRSSSRLLAPVAAGSPQHQGIGV